MARKARLLIVFGLVAALAIVAIWTQIAPVYQAQAELRVRSYVPHLVFETEDTGSVPNYDALVNTQVSIIRSPTILQRVLDQSEIRETQWYKHPPQSLVQGLLGKTTVAPMDRLRDALVVQLRPESEIIDLCFTDISRQEAMLIVNTVLDHFMAYAAEKTDETVGALYQRLKSEYDALQRETEGREAVLAGLRRTLNTDSPQGLVSSRRLELDLTQSRLKDVQHSIDLLEWEKTKLKSLSKPGIAPKHKDAPAASSSVVKKPEYAEDADWRALDRNVRTARHNIASNKLDPNSSEAIQAAKDLAFAEELLRLREAQLDELWRNLQASVSGQVRSPQSGHKRALKSLEHQLERNQHEAQLLQARLATQSREYGDLFETAQTYEKELAVLTRKRALFKLVQQRWDQKTMERKRLGRIELLTRAFSPANPYRDRRVLYTVVVLVLCSLGLAAANWRMRRRGTA